MSTSSSPDSECSSSLLEEPPGSRDSEKLITEFKNLSSLISEKDFHSVTATYPFVSTEYYFSLASPSLTDPIMLQLCPQRKELEEEWGGMEDPLDEEGMSPVPGLVHRYPDRVLMVITNICFMNCRHCTRKRLWREGRRPRTLDEIRRMIDYIREHKKIRDVILSGGDPLTFSDMMLEMIIREIRSISHVEIIRIGSRAPVVKPSRITKEFAHMISKYRPVWLNTQFNHIREITPESSQAVQTILEAGVPVNNQSVLLKEINNTAEDILALCHGLLKIGVRPYYLFHCDPVSGTAHFRTSISEGMEIIKKMRGYTSGLAVPTFVVDAVGGGGKIPLHPETLVSKMGGKMVIRNYSGKCFMYDDYNREVLKI